MAYKCDEGRPSAWTGTFRSSSKWGWSHPLTATAWAKSEIDALWFVGQGPAATSFEQAGSDSEGLSQRILPWGVVRISMDHLARYLRRSGPL